MSDYDFYVGDIVEDVDGRMGYISSICHCEQCKKRGFYEPTIKYRDGTEDYISNYSVKTVHLDYRRIGKYEFYSDNSKRIPRNNMKKSITWYQLHKRIGKQPIYKTQNIKVQVLVDGELKECTLVFVNNGSDFHLEPI